MVTQNYGLAGGKLDSTKHMEAALPRLCFPDEVRSYRDAIMPPPAPQIPHFKGN